MTDPKQPEAQEAPASEREAYDSALHKHALCLEYWASCLDEHHSMLPRRFFDELHGAADQLRACARAALGKQPTQEAALESMFSVDVINCVRVWGLPDGYLEAFMAGKARPSTPLQPTQELPPPDVPNTHAQPGGAFFQGSYSRALVERIVAAQEAPADAKDAARIWIDCEFNEHAGRHELISMGLVADDGREWYEVLPCPRPGAWVAENVIPILGKSPCSRESFSESLREFLAPYPAIHVVADWPSDIALFCDALITAPGCRIDTPPLTLEVIRLDGESELPHNALADARGIRDVHLAALQSHQEGK